MGKNLISIIFLIILPVDIGKVILNLKLRVLRKHHMNLSLLVITLGGKRMYEWTRMGENWSWFQMMIQKLKQTGQFT